MLEVRTTAERLSDWTTVHNVVVEQTFACARSPRAPGGDVDHVIVLRARGSAHAARLASGLAALVREHSDEPVSETGG